MSPGAVVVLLVLDLFAVAKPSSRCRIAQVTGLRARKWAMRSPAPESAINVARRFSLVSSRLAETTQCSAVRWYQGA